MRRPAALTAIFGHSDLTGVYAQRLNALDQKLLVRGALRLSASRLYATEMLVLGGASSIRGYRQNAVLGDKGYWASVEYQVPLGRLMRQATQTQNQAPAPGNGHLSQIFAPRTLTAGVFVDLGKVGHNTPSPARQTESLSSIGVHLVWTPPVHGTTVDVAFAAPLNRTPYRGSYADHGLSFRLSTSF